MPVMDGYEATRKIRELQLIAHSSKLIAEDRIKVSGVGFQVSASKELQDSALSPQSSEHGPQASNLQPPTSNIPIIAMTAHAMAGDEDKSLQAGMNGHVTKPIDPDQLFATLQKWIKPVAERTVVPKSLPASGGPPVLDAPPEPGSGGAG